MRTFSQILYRETTEVILVDVGHYCMHLKHPISKQVKIFSPIHACLKSWNGTTTVLYLSATLIISISPAL
jgi:hypothetical protein